MRILHIGYNDLSGGASEVMTTLNRGLKSKGYDSSVIVLHKMSNDEAILVVGKAKPSFREKTWQSRVDSSRSEVTNTFFSATETYRKDVLKYIKKNEFDIIHLHWIEKYISLLLLQDIIELGVPVVWTLHDERPYTGGCHCTFGCQQFMKDCDDCIQLKRYKKLPHDNITKRKLMGNSLRRIALVSPSSWIFYQASRSGVFSGNENTLIFHGVDISLYKPGKLSLNLVDRPLEVLFIAANLDARHKGFSDFVNVIDCYVSLSPNKINLNIVGNSINSRHVFTQSNVNATYHGFVKDKKKILRIYQNADVLINTSSCESFSLVTAEAMACGCVPITYGAGGIKDIIGDGFNSTVEFGDYEKIAHVLFEFDSDRDSLRKYAINCIDRIINKFSLSEMLSSYEDLYDKEIKKMNANVRMQKVSIKKRKFHLLDKFIRRTKKLKESKRDIRGIFNDIYSSNTWNSDEARSGTGSEVSQTEVILAQLPLVLKEHDVKVLLDIPCGDFNWMKRVNFSDMRYIGADIVDELIRENTLKYASRNVEFLTLDLISDVLPEADLILCRDCLVHFSYGHIKKVFENLLRYPDEVIFLTTTFIDREKNIDISTGDWRPINFLCEPFNFPGPIFVINESCTEYDGIFSDKSLVAWRVGDIREKAAGFIVSN